MGRPTRKKGLRKSPKALPRAVPRRPPTTVSDEAFATLTEKLSGSSDERSTASLRVDCISADPEQPRRNFSDQELGELAQSIADLGVLQPIIVRPNPNERGRYILIMGERRWRAAAKAGLKTIPVVVREVAKLRRAQLVENLQREDLEMMEIARALHAIVEEARAAGESQASVARAIGKDRAYVTRYLRLLELLPELQKLLEDKRCNDQQVLLTLDQFVREDPSRHRRLREFLVKNPEFALSRANLPAIQEALSGDRGHKKPEKATRHSVQPAIAHLLSVTGVQTTVTRLANELRIACQSADELARVEAWLAGKSNALE